MREIKEVIADNFRESTMVVWDGERITIVQTTKGVFPDVPMSRTIILTPDEAEVLSNFIRQHCRNQVTTAKGKGEWCLYSDRPLFCQEDGGCDSCQIYLDSLTKVVPWDLPEEFERLRR